jgi:hypothetical protein
VGRRWHSVRRVAAPSTECSRMPGEGRGRAHTRCASPACRLCCIDRPVFSFLTVHFRADGPSDPNSTASSRPAAVAIHLLANVRRLHPFRCARFRSFSNARRMRRATRLRAARILTSVPRRGFSLYLDPDLGEFSPEGIEQTRREKPIGVEVARAGEGAQVEARPRKFVHLVDDNP